MDKVTEGLVRKLIEDLERHGKGQLVIDICDHVIVQIKPTPDYRRGKEWLKTN